MIERLVSFQQNFVRALHKDNIDVERWTEEWADLEQDLRQRKAQGSLGAAVEKVALAVAQNVKSTTLAAHSLQEGYEKAVADLAKQFEELYSPDSTCFITR
jgi:ABC-type transporter Mla subunit MlaD